MLFGLEEELKEFRERNKLKLRNKILRENTIKRLGIRQIKKKYYYNIFNENYNNIDIELYNKNKKEFLKKIDKSKIIERIFLSFYLTLTKRFGWIIEKKDIHKLIGCSVLEFKKHLLKTIIVNKYNFNDFIKNYGIKFHIDHIVPLSKFNLKCLFHLKLAFNYTNLQVLLSKDNYRKSGSLVVKTVVLQKVNNIEYINPYW
jgi:hypothetical protein